MNQDDSNNAYISFIILSLFCAGGLYAYGREALRLKRLRSTGNEAVATIRKKEKIDAGSESAVHFLVTYEFIDEQGNSVVHEQDLNSRKFFDSLAVGNKIEILYQRDRAKTSYPLSQIRNDSKIANCIVAGILLLWGVMGVILI